jgi:tRNA-splicing ligase RtcB
VSPDLTEADVRPFLKQLVERLMTAVPAGVGSGGEIHLDKRELDKVLANGARWAVENGYGTEADLRLCEEGGAMNGANPDKVSARAKQRGGPQLGTLGSGNHFLEIQAVERIYEPEAASVMGIKDIGQVVMLIHTGSRGLGHQVCDDALRVMASAMPNLLPMVFWSVVLILSKGAIPSFIQLAMSCATPRNTACPVCMWPSMKPGNTTL